MQEAKYFSNYAENKKTGKTIFHPLKYLPLCNDKKGVKKNKLQIRFGVSMKRRRQPKAYTLP
ncbi:MAG: hypothetical protein AB4050_04505 [Synechococcus sp.]